jgi:hypothetical protein
MLRCLIAVIRFLGSRAFLHCSAPHQTEIIHWKSTSLHYNTIITMGYLLMAFGTLVLIHATFSCLHYRSLLLELDDAEAESHPLPPMDVWVEIVAGFLILLLAELTRNGSSLQPVSNATPFGAAKKRPLMAPAFRTRDFDIYAGRCKGL